jgi:RNA polymerase sigma-70 factor (ECF subfamily)
MTAPAALLDAAHCGDATAFEQLVAPYRAELQAYCYRMLGSLHDAEDAVQESLVRAWRSVGRLDERGFVRAWLYRIATNRCLTAIEQRSRRELPAGVTPGTPAAEISWLEPYRPLARGALPGPRERPARVRRGVAAPVRDAAAALILREVLGFTAAEAAEQLGTSAASVNSALQRARKAIGSTAPTQQTMLRDLGDAAVDDIAARWTGAWHASDVNAIVAMLAVPAHYSQRPGRVRRLPLGRGRRGVRSRRPRRPHAARTDASRRLPPSSPPTSFASGCRRASVRRGDPLTGRR